MQTVEMERIPAFTSHFVRARIRGADYSLLGGFPFIFNPAKSSAGPSGECNLQHNTLSRYANGGFGNLQPNKLSRHANFGFGNLQPNELSRHASIGPGSTLPSIVHPMDVEISYLVPSRL